MLLFIVLCLCFFCVFFYDSYTVCRLQSAEVGQLKEQKQELTQMIDDLLKENENLRSDAEVNLGESAALNVQDGLQVCVFFVCLFVFYLYMLLIYFMYIFVSDSHDMKRWFCLLSFSC